MSKNSPTVAVIIATYNGELFLKQQLDSILSQTYQHFHLYIADDASSDNTPKILETYSKKFSDKITVHLQPVKLGVTGNFEYLLNTCNEEYIAFCDQDDIWEEQNLAIKINAMLDLEKVYPDLPLLVHSDLSVIDAQDRILHNSYFFYRKYFLRTTKDVGHILGPCGVMGNTMLINKALKNIVLPFDAKIDVHDYWIALHAELFGIRKTLSKQLVRYRIHRTNTSNSLEKIKNKRSPFRLLHRNFQLPNLETNRKLFLAPLLSKVTDPQDQQVIRAYLEYLEFKNNKFVLFYKLIRHGLIKRDVYFRANLLIKMLFNKKYKKV